MTAEAALLLVFAIWPIAGVVSLRLARHRGLTIPEAETFPQVLGQMYLWPFILFRYRNQDRR
ncbi:MAG: hypothetical protein KDH88_06760 [Chromatiales bacterium]|nr:hypothetical protein [Chromatiales bacterium]